MSEQRSTLKAQAEELAMRAREAREDVSKLRSKKPVEMIQLTEFRIDVLEDAAATLSWLANNAEAVKAAAGEDRPAESAPPAEPPTPEVDEWGDPIAEK